MQAVAEMCLQSLLCRAGAGNDRLFGRGTEMQSIERRKNPVACLGLHELLGAVTGRQVVGDGHGRVGHVGHIERFGCRFTNP